MHPAKKKIPVQKALSSDEVESLRSRDVILIEFERFRARVLNVLTSLPKEAREEKGEAKTEAVIHDDINEAIQSIKHLTFPKPKFSSTLGFADIYIKIILMTRAIEGISEEYYNKLTIKDQLKVQTLLDSSLEEELLKDQSTKRSTFRLPLPGSKQLAYSNLSNFLFIAGQFEHQWWCGEVALGRKHVNSKIVLVSSEHDAFKQSFMDVELSESHLFTLATESVGSTSMAPCLYIRVSGQLPNNKTLVIGCHNSDPNIKAILYMQKRLLEKGVIEDSLETILIGGQIYNVTDFLKILLVGKQIHLADVKLLGSYGMCHDAVELTDKPGKIFVCTTINEPHLINWSGLHSEAKLERSSSSALMASLLGDKPNFKNRSSSSTSTSSFSLSSSSNRASPPVETPKSDTSISISPRFGGSDSDDD